MTSPTHIGGGVIAALLLHRYTGIDLVYCLAGGVFGSVAPDIDTDKSWISQTIPLIDEFIRYIGRKNKTIHKYTKHRGITHSVAALFIMMCVYVKFRNEFVLSVTVGVCSHIVLDWLSKIYFSTGTDKEKFVYYFLWVIVALMIIL